MTAEQQKETSVDRRDYIGSSDIAAIIGISPWKTALDVWEEKVSTEPEESLDAPVLRRGKRAEPYVIEWLQEEKDFFIVDRNRRVTHPDYPFLAAETDFTYVIDQSREEKALCDADNLGHGEAKSIGQFADWKQWGETGTQECPAYYIAQVLFALECNGFPEATIAGAANWDDVRTYLFQRDAETGAALVQKAVDFWQQHVLTRIPPPPKTIEDTKTLLKRYGSFDWSASDKAVSLVGTIQGWQKLIKQSEGNLDVAKGELLTLLYEAAQTFGVEGDEFKKAQILGPDGKPLATLSEIQRAGYTVKPTKFVQLRFAKEKE